LVANTRESVKHFILFSHWSAAIMQVLAVDGMEQNVKALFRRGQASLQVRVVRPL
jgi:hypothetical protein